MMGIGGINQSIGLALLTGSGSAPAAGPSAVESRAVRLAKAQFTLQPVAPPWSEKVRSAEAPQLAAIRRMTSIVDPREMQPRIPKDVQAAFTTYRALDRLRLLAGAAARAGIGEGERASLDASFARGLTDLQAYLIDAPRERLTLSFGAPARKVDSVATQAVEGTDWRGRPVVAQRATAIPNLGGLKVFELRLARSGSSDHLRVDLSALPQPPTLDDVASAFNEAIAAVPLRDPGGTILLDSEGNPLPKWTTSFAVVRSDAGWGLELRTMGVEQVTLHTAGAGDALMVAANQSASGQVRSAGLMRFDLEGSGLQRTALSPLTAVDRMATAAANLLPAETDPLTGKPVTNAVRMAPTSASAVATSADGFTYVVGTSSGDTGVQLGDGQDDLQLTKLDSNGAVIWQRMLGTGGTGQGTAITLAPDGRIIVAGTAAGDVDGVVSDGDMLVACFAADGEEQFATLIRAIGADRATSVTAGPDGMVVVGGQTAAGQAVLAMVDGMGRLTGRRILADGGFSSVRGVQVTGDGSLLALVQAGGDASLHHLDPLDLSTDLGSVALGQVDARALAVDPATGTIGVAASAIGSGGRDGLVIQLDAQLGETSRTSLTTTGDDQVDSFAFADGRLHVGGRTNGDLGAPRSGVVDGFVASVELTSGRLSAVHQWGRADMSIGKVTVAAAAGAGEGLTPLGFRAGLLNPTTALTLAAQTSLRPGDSFLVRVDGGKQHRITIDRDDMLDSLVQRVSRLVDSRAVRVVAARQDTGRAFRLEVQPGHVLELASGPAGRDALTKLGMEPGRLVAAAPTTAKSPRVQPGGNYGLELGPALNLADASSAKLALEKIEAAISTTKSAFRSLYWDDNKAAIVDGQRSGRVSSYQAAQLARYQDALNKLSGGW